MKNIWVCHPLWEEKRSSALISLRIGLEEITRVGGKTFVISWEGSFD